MEFILGLLFLTIAVLFMSIKIVSQRNNYIVERLGKYNRILTPGLNLVIPGIEEVVCKQNLKIQELVVNVDTKTKDNVFTAVEVAVQYQVDTNKVYESYYELDNPVQQIGSYVFDVVRSNIPKQEVNEVFDKKDEIAQSVKDNLSDIMGRNGFLIVNTLVTNIALDDKVQEAMNSIQTEQRNSEAAKHKAEAEKIRIVAEAEAQAESKKLQGQGIANQRKAIADGLRESIDTLKESGVNTHEANQLLLVTQHFDTLREMSSNSTSNVIFMDKSVSSTNDISQQLMASIQASK
jgi:regulator of protease activity HflC (stomatin/prohibitin superfamily)